MAQKVADVLSEMLMNAGVKRCYGIIRCLNPLIDRLRRNGKIEFIPSLKKNTASRRCRRAYLTGVSSSVWNRRPRCHSPVQWADGCPQGESPIIAIAGDVGPMSGHRARRTQPLQVLRRRVSYTARVVGPGRRVPSSVPRFSRRS
jgi:pyruvate dehydrogenase (quinone)